MDKKHYIQLMAWADQHPASKKVLCILNKIMPVLLGIIYVLFILCSGVIYPVLLLDLVLRPLLCFIFITLLRNYVNAPRPYDIYHTKPMCGYHPGKNKSFPSRHTASAWIIALEIFRISNGFGILCMALAAGVGCIRVICGNHFVKDVLAAFAIAFLFHILL